MRTNEKQIHQGSDVGGKKEGFLEWEARGDLGNLEDTLKTFFVAES